MSILFQSSYPADATRVLALAIFYLTEMDNCAHYDAEQTSMQDALKALLNQNSNNINELLPDPFTQRQAYQLFEKHLSVSGNDNNEQSIARVKTYTLQSLIIHKKFSQRPDMQTLVSDGLNQALRQAEHFGYDYPALLGNIAELYQNSFSKLSIRIQVRGQRERLSQPRNAERIRCYLFIAMRYLHLWRQLGGRGYHLVFKRKAILHSLNELKRHL